MAAVLALRLANRQRSTGWALAAGALALMVGRRALTLYQVVALGHPIDPVAESIALIISCLLVGAGVELGRSIRRPPPDLSATERVTVIAHTLRSSLIVGILAFVGAAILVLFAYETTRDTLSTRIAGESLDIARLLQAEATSKSTSRDAALAELADSWREIRERDRTGYLCVVGPDGRLLMHTSRPEQVGRDVSATAIRWPTAGGPANLAQLLANKSDWAGTNRNPAGERQIAAYAYSPSLRSLVAVHVPQRELDAAIRATAMPWILGLGVVLFTVLPVSVFLLYRTGVEAQSAATAALDSQAEVARRYRQIVETEPECVKIVDPGGALLEMNPAGLAMLEAETIDEARAKPLVAYVAAEHRGAFAELHRRVLAGESGRLEFEVVGLRGGRRWLETHAAPLRGADGRPTALLGVTRDITERRRLEEDYRQAQKLEAVGQLAGGIAHDFNNLLTVILGNASLILEHDPGAEVRTEQTRAIVRAAERAAALTRDLLLVGRKRPMRMTSTDLNELVRHTVEMLQRVLGENLQIAPELDPDLPPVAADAAMIDLLLLNLAVNARDAMPEGGTIRIATRAVEVSASEAASTPGSRAGRFARLSVADSGCGIPPEALPRIFDPFFTTKEVGKGTGMGLATATSIVLQHCGWTTVATGVGAGTTFAIHLPFDRDAAGGGNQPSIG